MAEHEDPYLYPGTDVLQNRFGVKDAKSLRAIEYELASQRMSEALPRVPLTSQGYQAVHKHIFQDIYDWAGQLRTVDLSKGSSLFAPPRFLAKEMEDRLASVRADKRLLSKDRNLFAESAAEHINEINARHPFREGNGRTQRAFLQILAHRAGHELSIDRIEPARWMDASIVSFHQADNVPMREILTSALESNSSQDKDAERRMRVKQLMGRAIDDDRDRER